MSRPALDFRAVARAKAEARGDLLRALGGLPADVREPEPETPRTTGFDGGARKSVPVPESHEAWLLRVIEAERRPTTGGMFGL